MKLYKKRSYDVYKNSDIEKIDFKKKVVKKEVEIFKQPCLF